MDGEIVSTIEQNKEKDVGVSLTPNPSHLLELAIQNKLDVGALKELMQMKKEWDAEIARKEYVIAMARFQSECPIIIKSVRGTVTKSGDLAYKFAPMDVILATKNEAGKAVKELIAENGFSYTFDIPITADTGVSVKMKINHIGGHEEISNSNMPFVEKTGVMSPPQVVGATRTYAIRYAFMNGFGIITGDEDNDAISTGYYEEFEKIVEKWKDTTYIRKVLGTITHKSAFRTFLIDLPTIEQTDRLLKIMSKIRLDEKKVWNDWQRHKPATAENMLKLLEAKAVTVEKVEVKNGNVS